MEEIRIGLVQMAMGKSRGKNVEKAVRMIDEAARRGADIVCLPELFETTYFPAIENANAEAVELPGRTAERLSSCARENGVTLIAGSVFESYRGRRYNTSLIFDSEGRQIGIYRKVHVPHDPYFYEKNYFSPGRSYRVVATEKCKVGVLICYDQWFPEAARVNKLLGADVLFYPTAIGTVSTIEQTEGDWKEAWKTVQRGHAIANSMVVAAVNRVGTEGDMNFWGGSFVCDQFGNIIAEADDSECVTVATCDIDLGRNIEKGWGFIRNRRPGTYGRLVE
ncbi:MAG: acyltransferase [Thermoplasmata archaeon YP2-bin.285]|uniref:Acyltransferase n=1 Tax=Candidatus Sysuiplasma superficiale TaxID=2823368 RepID=A0A8J7YMR1_9ARCH|nr:acyltransferase [Candidatus Sysuiplasma superficiale]